MNKFIEYSITAIIVVFAILLFKSCVDKNRSVVIKTEWVEETILVTYTNPPKHWRLRYTRIKDGKEFIEGGKHCSSFHTAKIRTGAKYKVKIKYTTMQDRNGETKTYRDTTDCTLLQQFPLPEVAA